MTPVEALKAATSASAAVLGLEAEWQPYTMPSPVMPRIHTDGCLRTCEVCNVHSVPRCGRLIPRLSADFLVVASSLHMQSHRTRLQPNKDGGLWTCAPIYWCVYIYIYYIVYYIIYIYIYIFLNVCVCVAVAYSILQSSIYDVEVKTLGVTRRW